MKVPTVSSIGGEDELTDQTFSRLSFDQLNLAALSFVRCRFERIIVGSLVTGYLDGITYLRDCVFDNFKVKSLSTGYSRFENCVFKNASIGEWHAEYTELVDCEFSGKLKRAIFYGRPHNPRGRVEADAKHRSLHGLPPQSDAYRDAVLRERNEFSGNDFSRAVFSDVEFVKGVDLSKQRLPEEGRLVLYDAEPILRAAADDVSHWNDGNEKSKAEFILERLLGRVNDGQSQLYVVPSKWSGSGADKLFDTIRRLLGDA
ncbi:hypothetical protein GCM10009681_43280 [Luedemannella helvata]|uniref:Pentapeptide repeat-containing protein n=1 Tax=Luedemannella helvata TaxID=349315 RepID=A0ABP4X1P5_9ACTN